MLWDIEAPPRNPQSYCLHNNIVSALYTIDPLDLESVFDSPD